MTEGIVKRYELDRTQLAITDVIQTNVSDTLTGADARAAASDWIKNGFPNPASVGKKSTEGGFKYPMIIIDYSEVEMEQKVLDSSKHAIIHTVMIHCHSINRSNNTISGRQEANQLADACSYALMTTGKNQLNINAKLHGPDIIGTDTDVEFNGGHKVYVTTITYRFTRFD